MAQQDCFIRTEHGNYSQLNVPDERQPKLSLDSERTAASSLLRNCARFKDIETGRRTHAMAIIKGLDGDLVIGGSLIHMYAKCGFLMRARELFQGLQIRCVFAWTALIAGYVAFGWHKEALEGVDRMQLEGISPSACAFACSLKACGSTESPEIGQKLHMQIAKRGLLEGDHILGNSLIDMYARKGCFREANIVLQEILSMDLVAWTAMIAGYVSYGHIEEASECLKQMKIVGILPDSVTFICFLKGCNDTGDITLGKGIHLEITKLGLEQCNSGLRNALVDFYANCSLFLDAQEVLNKIPSRDVVSWTALIAGYSKYGYYKEALESFRKMHSEGVIANEISFICILKACANCNATKEGREIHSETYRTGLFERDPRVGNVLVEMYASCGSLMEAEKVFQQLPNQDAVSWTALIGGYSKYGYGEKALDYFEQMQHVGVSPDAIAYVCSLRSCAMLGAIYRGQEIHAEISRKGMVITEVEVGNAVVSMYAKCDRLAEAQKVFANLQIQDTISWNAMISGYVKHERDEEALDLLRGMHRRGVPFDSVTVVCGLKACGNLGSIDQAVQLHCEISRTGSLDKDPLVGNALLEMYANSGLLWKAYEVFEKIPLLDVVSWTLLITGLAQVGEAKMALCLFEKMGEECLYPNVISFVSVLNACSHAGLVEMGHMHFKQMIEDIDITPSIEHYSCLIDLHGRAGQLDKVTAIVKNMPFHPNQVVWRSILGASRKWGDILVGLEVFEHALGLDDKDLASYINMLNIFTQFGSYK